MNIRLFTIPISDDGRDSGGDEPFFAVAKGVESRAEFLCSALGKSKIEIIGKNPDPIHELKNYFCTKKKGLL